MKAMVLTIGLLGLLMNSWKLAVTTYRICPLATIQKFREICATIIGVRCWWERNNIDEIHGEKGIIQ